MRFEGYQENLLNEQAMEQAFLKIKDWGAKIGVKVEKTKSIAQMLMDASAGLKKFITLLFHYSTHEDVLDAKARQKLENDLKTLYRSIDEREVVAFLYALDKLSFGITSAPRKFLETLVGIKLSAYNTYETQTEQLITSLLNARTILGNIGEKEDLKTISDMIDKYRSKA